MLLITHIAIALASLLLATFIIIKPSRRGVTTSNVMIIATLVSGSLLLLEGAHLFDLCLSGLIYSVAAVSMTLAAQRRLQDVTLS